MIDLQNFTNSSIMLAENICSMRKEDIVNWCYQQHFVFNYQYMFFIILCILAYFMRINISWSFEWILKGAVDRQDTERKIIFTLKFLDMFIIFCLICFILAWAIQNDKIYFLRFLKPILFR